MDIEHLNSLQEKASLGDADAIIELIDFYLSNGDKVHAKLEAERLKYVHSTQAYRKLAYIYALGLLDFPDYEKAKYYYKLASEQGDISSGYSLALILIKENKAIEAIPYLTNGVSNNDIPSIKLLASLYLKGDILSKDLNIAKTLLKKALELGETGIYSSLGKICYQMKDYEEAFKYFSLGAQDRDVDCLYYLGLCYATGLGVKQDFIKSRQYYEQGANLNEPRCLYNLSLYYRNGVGVSQNIALADKLYQQAIENGFKK